MATYPCITIDLEKIEHNTRTIVDMASSSKIDVMGVTKACCGDPQVGRAMLRGGAVGLADSRIENIKKMKDAGIDTEFMLLRTPMPSQVRRVVEHADISLNTEIEVVKRISDECLERGADHSVVLMVEMGDLREGVNREHIEATVEKVLSMDGVGLSGLGMNLACYAGVVPTLDKVKEFDHIVECVEDKYGVKFQIISGGNSGNIPLLMDDPKSMTPSRINNLRIGEGILLGLETVNRGPIPGTNQDTFTIHAEMIEFNEKPSVPDGVVSQNAYGETPEFEDHGRINRGIVSLGRQDTIIEDLVPLDRNVVIMGSSSDHLVVRFLSEGQTVGSILMFRPRYGALVQAFTSPYIAKEYR
jgi:predicted amino acid racemase